MSHSTLTWFSGQIKPTQNEYFVVSVQQNPSGDLMVFGFLYEYDIEGDDFFVPPHFNYSIPSPLSYLKRDQIAYWAYVPKYVDLKHGTGKQSQIPEEK